MKNATTAFILVTLTPHLLWAQESLASQEKTIPGGTLAMAAYVALWFLLLGYFVVMTLRLRSLREDVRQLDKRIDELVD